MTEQLDLEDWLRDNPRQYPRQNGHSTLALNFARLQAEVNEANYKTYAERVKNDLLRKENQQLKDLLKECGKEFECLNRGGAYWTGDFDEILEKLNYAIGEKK